MTEICFSGSIGCAVYNTYALIHREWSRVGILLSDTDIEGISEVLSDDSSIIKIKADPMRDMPDTLDTSEFGRKTRGIEIVCRNVISKKTFSLFFDVVEITPATWELFSMKYFREQEEVLIISDLIMNL